MQNISFVCNIRFKFCIIKVYHDFLWSFCAGLEKSYTIPQKGKKTETPAAYSFYFIPIPTLSKKFSTSLKSMKANFTKPK